MFGGKRTKPSEQPATLADLQRRLHHAQQLIIAGKNGSDLRLLTQGESMLKSAMAELPAGEPVIVGCLALLSSAALSRFRWTGEPAALDEALRSGARAVELGGPADPNRLPALVILSEVLGLHQEANSSLEGAQECVRVLRQIVPAVPEEQVSLRAAMLHNLGVGLRQVAGHSGSATQLDEAVRAHTTAVDVADPADPQTARYLLSLADAHAARYEHRDDLEDLAAAVRAVQAALSSIPPDHPERPRIDGWLGTLLQVEQERRSAAAHRPVVPAPGAVLVSGGPPQLPPEQVGADPVDVVRHGNEMARRIEEFERTGDLAGLEAAVTTGRTLLDTISWEHPAALFIARCLGGALLRRFEATADRENIDTAITLLRAVVDAPPGREDEVHHSLNILAVALIGRFRRFQDSADLDEAVRVAERAVQACPPDDPNGHTINLTALGAALVERFEHLRDPRDLDRSIDIGREVLIAVRYHGWNPQAALVSLSRRVRTRFLHSGDPADINEAVALGRQSLTLLPPEHPDRPNSHFNLGLALLDRASLTDGLDDLDSAITHLTEAIDDDSPALTNVALTLARAEELHAERAGQRPDVIVGVLLKLAATAPAGAPADRVRAAIAWGEHMARWTDNWTVAATGFAEAVSLLPLAAWRGLRRSDQERLLTRWPDVASDAAACAIAAGRLEWAVELLDQGRSVLWGQALECRSDLAELRDAHPELAGRLDHVRSRLDGGDGDSAQLSALAWEWEQLLGQVRQLPGFWTFLLPQPFDELALAAADGPVIIVNVSRYRCDALIVTKARAHLVPLPDLHTDDVRRHVDRYLAVTGDGGAAGPAQQAVLATLEWLWDTVAGPVFTTLDQLGFSGRRCWWSPTGPLTLLPLHAAGHHDTDGDGSTVLDRVVSSYTPTLRDLARARRGTAASPEHRRLLIMACPEQPWYALSAPPLPEAEREAVGLARRFPHRHTLRGGPAATRVEALRLLPTHAWAHFACHGGQDPHDPRNAALYLADSPLKISDITSLRLDHAELAVLSACQTAVGGVDLPGEAIHLAAALQLAGFRHVVSTLSVIGDESGREVTEGMYARLTAGDDGLDAAAAAEALHDVVTELRRRHPYQPTRWAVFAHFGP